MSDIKWTDAQRDAIDSRSGSVLVSAAAGSGKTAVLVERIIQAVCDPVDPIPLDRMLIVTFTRAASAEMRSRIEKALDDRLASDPRNSYLLNQKRLLYSARISTIDSFCIDFVRQYFFKLDIQSDFRIADENELAVMRDKALDNTLEFFYKQNDRDFLRLISSVCSYKNDDRIRDFIKKTYFLLSSIPFSERWFDDALGLYDTDKYSFEDTPYFSLLLRYAMDSVRFAMDINLTALKFVQENENIPEDKKAGYESRLVDDSRVLLDLYNSLENGSWNDIKAAFEGYAFGRLPAVKKGICDLEKEYVQNSRKQVSAEVKALSALFTETLEELDSKTKNAYPVVRAFMNCVKKFREELFSIKLEKNAFGFSDISSFMVSLLYDYSDGEPRLTDTAREISQQFDAVMVDEFQDINDIQNIIFKAVTADRNNLFVVGDVKQSIYTFRQAKPQIFINYKEKYPIYSRQEENYPSKIILDRNFRSARGVTEAVNDIFKVLMRLDTGGIEYNDEEKLVCGTDYPESDSPCMELMLISSENLNEEKGETELSLEAVRVAERIYKLINEDKLMIKDGKKQRRVEYGDIAILIRSPKGMTRRAVTFIEVLNHYGIPTVSDEKSSFFDQNEIKVMLNILRVIDNPIQDIPVLSVALSPMFAFTADDIAEIRAKYRKMPIYNAILKASAEKAVCRDFIAFVDKMRALSVMTTVDRLIGAVLELTGFGAVTSALSPTGVKNLNLLKEYARSFASNGYKTLGQFISFIDRIRENNIDLNAGSEITDESANAVHIKSIHKSKGLEYPVCFLCCTATEFNLDDAGEDLIVDSDLGAGFRLRKDYVKYESIQRKALSMNLKDNSVFEEIRVLYVALTRAKQKLIVSCVKKNPLDYLRKLEAKMPVYPIPSYVIKKTRTFSDWLFMCALANPNCDLPRQNIEPDFLGFDREHQAWGFSIVDGPYMKLSNQSVKKTQSQPSDKVDVDFLRGFEKKLSFEYPKKPLSRLPQKVSASDLSHKDNKIFNKLLRKPDFVSGERSDGAERGTAFHTFMERCDFVSAREDPGAEAKRLAKLGFISERQLSLLDFERLSGFLSSPLFDRIRNSDCVEREYTFTIEINASDYDNEIEEEFGNDKLVMQGAVDLFFVEASQIVLVDYKTDRVGDSSKLVSMYHKQLELYKRALEEILSLPVKEMIIYSVHKNETISIKG